MNTPSYEELQQQISELRAALELAVATVELIDSDGGFEYESFAKQARAVLKVWP